jgi:Uma2 family endonuclease
MTQPLRTSVHLFDYLASEEASPARHEYVGGQVFAMTGGTTRHNRIAGNLYSRLLPQLDGTPCQVFINDMKLHVQAADSVYYPDVLVSCAGGVAGSAKIVHDASFIAEVQSESTAEIDRREKLVADQKLPSLRACWIVSQDERRVEVHARDGSGQWTAAAYTGDEVLPPPLPGMGALPLAALYAGTDLA